MIKISYRGKLSWNILWVIIPAILVAVAVSVLFPHWYSYLGASLAAFLYIVSRFIKVEIQLEPDSSGGQGGPFENAPSRAPQWDGGVASLQLGVQQGVVNYDMVSRPYQVFRWRVDFGASFKSKPTIMLSVIHFDASAYTRKGLFRVHEHNSILTEDNHPYDGVTRYDCCVLEVSNNHCVIQVKTWASNLIYAVTVEWVAIGEMEPRLNIPSPTVTGPEKSGYLKYRN